MKSLYTIGFTGTREGMTREQKIFVRNLLSQAEKGVHFLHGACVGADMEADAIAEGVGLRRLMMPSDIPSMTAPCTGATPVRDPAPPLKRNRQIVQWCKGSRHAILLAAPKTAREERRSGTWYTVRYARREHIPVVLVTPGGGVDLAGPAVPPEDVVNGIMRAYVLLLKEVGAVPEATTDDWLKRFQ